MAGEGFESLAVETAEPLPGVWLTGAQQGQVRALEHGGAVVPKNHAPKTQMTISVLEDIVGSNEAIGTAERRKALP